jgi:phenylpyruvate tautomerase PptA (4-oxalocrotonate tautomerase family)
MTVPHGDLSDDHKSEMIERLTTTVSDLFWQRKGEDVRQFVVVHIRETAEGGYAVGGEIIG